MTTTTMTTTDRISQAFSVFPKHVGMLPLSGPDNLRTEFYGLFTEEGKNIGNAVKKGYRPHTVDDVLAFTQSAISAFPDSDWTIETSWNDGHRVTVGPTHEHRRSIFGTRDAIFPRFNLNAGYDGRAFTANLGYFRDCCLNLAEIQAISQTFAFSLRHTSNLREHMVEMIDQFSHLGDKWDSLVTVAQGMQERQMAVSDFMREMFPAVGDAGKPGERAAKRIEAILTRIARERSQFGAAIGELKTATAWELYNGVQGYVQHDVARRGQPTNYARALLAMKDQRVKQAMSLCLAS